MRDNIFVSFLRILNVKHTKLFSNKRFNEHPYKYSLFGISSMLTEYGIGNIGLKIENKEDLTEIQCPFIAHIGSDFVIVETISDNKVHFIQDGKRIIVDLEEFYKIWTGYVLLAETNELSKEPNYAKHKKESIFTKIQILLPLVFVFFLLIFSIYNYGSFNELGFNLLLIINFVGAYVGYLLILKQLQIQSNYTDKICSLFKYSDCNSILESDASKFLGFLGWSEIGFGYFVSNVIILSFLPFFLPYLAIINLLCLPFSFWSIWYQKFKANQWCPLCILTLILLWSIFIVNYIFGNLSFSEFSTINFIAVGGIYVTLVFVINVILKFVTKGMKSTDMEYEINSIKADEKVFKTLLTKQSRYNVSKATSQILLGDINSSNLITVFSNPHCNPCAKMHKRVIELIEQNKDVCIQYIFSSFGEDLDISNKYLIGVYQQKNGDLAQILDKWFEKGKNNKENFFSNFPIDFNDESIENEFFTHEKWKELSGLRATPTILFNGYKLPDNYKLEDLRYFTKLNLETI